MRFAMINVISTKVRGVSFVSTVTENDLQELKVLILNSQKALETRLTVIETRLTTIESSQTEIKEKIQGVEITLAALSTKTEGLEKRVDDLNSRLNIMMVGFLSIIGVLVTGILGFIGKVVFFSGNP